MTERVIDRINDLADQLREQAWEAEKLGKLPDETAKMLRAAGPIRLPQSTSEISIGPDGAIHTEQGSVGKFRLVQFADAERLENAGGNLYRSATPPREARAARLEVGALERSNVNPFTELMQVSDIAGAYQTAAARITALHDLMRTAISRLADTTA